MLAVRTQIGAGLSSLGLYGEETRDDFCRQVIFSIFSVSGQFSGVSVYVYTKCLLARLMQRGNTAS